MNVNGGDAPNDEIANMLPRKRGDVLGMCVDATNYADATNMVIGWAGQNESRYVCVANVHMVMEAYGSVMFQTVVNSADLVTPDGMPLVWMLRLQGYGDQTRVYGPDLTLHVCAAAAQAGAPVGFYGAKEDVLNALIDRLKRRFPELKISYAYSPPFRPLTTEEDEAVVDEIQASGTQILFVGLGCPKQEAWMATHKERLKLVMIGVGAAFDFHSGRVKQAPAWLQSVGLEWLFRLSTDPRRLWRRYIYNNPRFVSLAIVQLATNIFLKKKMR